MLPDIDSIASYNGAVNGVLIDYSPVENPNTDQPAAGATAMQGSTAMMTRMAIRAYAVFNYNGSTTTLVEHDSLWGNSAPVAPTPARVGTGSYTLTWPASVADAIGVSHTISLRRGWGETEGSVTSWVVKVARGQANVANITITSGGVAADATNQNVVIWMI